MVMRGGPQEPGWYRPGSATRPRLFHHTRPHQSLSLEYTTPDLSPAESPLGSQRGDVPLGIASGNDLWRRMGYDSTDDEDRVSNVWEEHEETSAERDDDLQGMRQRFWEQVWSMGTPVDGPPLHPAYLPKSSVKFQNVGDMTKGQRGGGGTSCATVQAAWPEHVGSVAHVFAQHNMHLVRTEDKAEGARTRPLTEEERELLQMREEFTVAREKLRETTRGSKECTAKEGPRGVPVGELQIHTMNRDYFLVDDYLHGDTQCTCDDDGGERGSDGAPGEQRTGAGTNRRPLPARALYSLIESGYGVKQARCSRPIARAREELEELPAEEEQAPTPGVAAGRRGGGGGRAPTAKASIVGGETATSLAARVQSRRNRLMHAGVRRAEKLHGGVYAGSLAELGRATHFDHTAAPPSHARSPARSAAVSEGSPIRPRSAPTRINVNWDTSLDGGSARERSPGGARPGWNDRTSVSRYVHRPETVSPYPTSPQGKNNVPSPHDPNRFSMYVGSLEKTPKARPARQARQLHGRRYPGAHAHVHSQRGTWRSTSAQEHGALHDEEGDAPPADAWEHRGVGGTRDGVYADEEGESEDEEEQGRGGLRRFGDGGAMHAHVKMSEGGGAPGRRPRHLGEGDALDSQRARAYAGDDEEELTSPEQAEELLSSPESQQRLKGVENMARAMSGRGEGELASQLLHAAREVELARALVSDAE